MKIFERVSRPGQFSGPCSEQPFPAAQNCYSLQSTYYAKVALQFPLIAVCSIPSSTTASLANDPQQPRLLQRYKKLEALNTINPN